jgi:hypothetical protein
MCYVLSVMPLNRTKLLSVVGLLVLITHSCLTKMYVVALTVDPWYL